MSMPGTSGSGHGLRTTRSATDGGCTRSDDMTDLLSFRKNRSVRTVRHYGTIRTMSTEPRLGPTSYLVLGIVALRGPSTPYDLKRFVQLTVGNFWPFPHTQLYAEPARLAEAGLLEETREETGRR